MQRNTQEVTITIGKTVIELYKNEFGYFRSICNGVVCERLIRWEDLFCTVCQNQKSCSEQHKVSLDNLSEVERSPTCCI
jgi:hypothetical protein